MGSQRKARPALREFGPMNEYPPIMPDWILEGVDVYNSGGAWGSTGAPTGFQPKVKLTVQTITQDGPDSPQITRAHTFTWTPGEAREWAERVLRMAEAMEQPYVEGADS